MASKKIENKNILANNLFEPTIKSANELLLFLNAIEEQLKELLKSSLALARNKPLAGYAGVEETERGLGGVKKASEGLAKVERDRRRLLKQLTDLANDQSIANEELRQRANQLRKEQRALARENIGLTDEYTRQSKQLNEARRAYKNLFLETENNRKGLKGLIFRFTSAGKELRKLEKNVTQADKKLKDLDTRVGQNQKRVGAYENAVKKLNSALTKIGVVAIALKALEQFKTSIDANSTSAAVFEKAIGAIGAVVGVVVNNLANALPAIGDLFSTLALSIQKFLLEFKLFREELSFIVDKKKVEELTKQIAELDKQLADNKGFAEIGKAFEGFGKNVVEAVKASNALVDATQRARLEIIQLNNNLSLEADALSTLSDAVKEVTKDGESLIEAELRLEEQSESNFISLQERVQATKQLLVIRAEILKQNVAIAQRERDLAAERVRLTEIGIKDGAKNIAGREALAAAEKNLAEVTANADKAIAFSKRELRDIETDIIERNLDFLIDDFDRRKTINERVIADETVTFARRQALLNETRRLNEQAFQDQQDEINKGIQAGKELLDFNELVALNDSKLIAQRIENSSLNDKLAGRALDIIKERIQFNRDLEESERDLIRARQEGREIEEDIELQIERLRNIRNNRIRFNAEFEKLEEERRLQEIENINERLKFVEAGSAEELRLRQELFNKLLEQEQIEGEKLIEQRKRLQEASFAVLDAAQEKFFNKQEDRLDRQLEAALANRSLKYMAL